MHDDIFVAFIIGSYERGSCGEAKIVAGMFLTKRGETLDYTGSPVLIGILGHHHRFYRKLQLHRYQYDYLDLRNSR